VTRPFDHDPLPARCSVLPLRDQVVFPHTIVPLHIGREKSIKALAPDDVMGGRKQILLVTQRRAGDADPAPDRIYRVGVLAHVMQGLRLDDGSIKALFECTTRGRIEYYTGNTEYLEAQVAPFVETAGSRDAIATLARSAVLQFTTYVKLHPKIPATTATSVGRIEDPSELADIIASHLAIDVPNKQEILESVSVADRLQRVLSSMSGALSPLQSAENERDSKANATRAGPRLPTLKFARYAGRYDWSAHEVPNPTWDQIELALRRLDQFEYPYVWLLLGSGGDWGLMEKEGYLNILGGNGIFCVDGATPFDGRRRLSVSQHSRETTVDVWLSDQGFSTEERFVCKDIETVIRVARHFSIQRRLDPSVEWTTAAAVGIWELF
jgi:Lon protease-like protein